MYNTKEGKTCVIYIRVSSERQVKGYSLDGQKHYLAECAERRGMTVLDTYVEEGKCFLQSARIIRCPHLPKSAATEVSEWRFIMIPSMPITV